jgi:hypothetical protein
LMSEQHRSEFNSVACDQAIEFDKLINGIHCN